MRPLIHRIISASLSPNTTRADVISAFAVMCTPWTWRCGLALDQVRGWFRKQYGVDSVALFQSGRVALYEVLKSFGIGTGDEVIIQAFTCVAVYNSVSWTGATAVFSDIDDSLNISPKDTEALITKKTKAIIVQHTFGNPADMTALAALSKKYNILLIEDCAHALGATWKGKPVGSFGDAACFSFGRDKAVSSVWGGAAIIREKNAALRLRQKEEAYPYPSGTWIFQQLLHPILFSLILPLYQSGLGKAMVAFFVWAHVISKPVDPREYTGGFPKEYLHRYPNALAQLLIPQLQRLDESVALRQQASTEYARSLDSLYRQIPIRTGASLLRYPVYCTNRDVVYQQAKRNGVLLGTWYSHVVDPKAVDLTAIGYTVGQCPKAEYAAANILNIPTLLVSSDLSYTESVLNRIAKEGKRRNKKI